MKVVILAGGRGTRLAEETDVRPKPMVEIGGKPILWHIMRQYDAFGFDEFVVALGYKGDVIKRWMVDYASLTSDLSVDFRDGHVRRNDSERLRWDVALVDTGLNTMTGGRVRRLAHHLGNQPFMLTYGDGVSDVDLEALLAFHRSHGRHCTISAVRPPARFGHLELNDGHVTEFSEKPQTGEGWINGGFCVVEPAVLDYIAGDDSVWESDVLAALARDGQLMAYQHPGFWQCMDTIRDRELLETLWESGNAPWAARPSLPAAFPATSLAASPGRRLSSTRAS